MVCDEPSRDLAFYFMRASEGRLRHTRLFIMDLASLATSPVVYALQFLSGPLSGGPALPDLFGRFVGT